MASDGSTTEITLNLWYIYGAEGVIYGRLLVHPYVDSGSTEDKRTRLRNRAETDYWVAREYDLPARFHTTLPLPDGSKVSPVLLLREYNLMDPLCIFEGAIDQLAEDLPKFSPWRIPRAPVVCITPLLWDGAHGLTPTYTESAPFQL